MDQSDELYENTGRFADAVISGDVEETKKLHAPTLIHRERIEPIGASVGDLDAREGDAFRTSGGAACTG